MSEREIERRMSQQRADIDSLYELVEQVDRKVDALEARVERRFDVLETRFDVLETRFDGLETRVYQGFEKLGEQLSDVLQRLGG